MIFQSFRHKKENRFAPRPLNFHENRLQLTVPSRHCSYESTTLQIGPFLSSNSCQRSLFFFSSGRAEAATGLVGLGERWPAAAGQGHGRVMVGLARGWPRPGLRPTVAPWPWAQVVARRWLQRTGR